MFSTEIALEKCVNRQDNISFQTTNTQDLYSNNSNLTSLVTQKNAGVENFVKMVHEYQKSKVLLELDKDKFLQVSRQMLL